MAKRYDPIMCMMVDKPDKAQDAANGWKVTVEQNLKKYEVLSSAMSASGAKLEAQKQYPNGTVLKVERAIVKDAKTFDVAPATQKYINTIRTESKSAAENFVRQAEQDEDVPENELKYVYKAYNDKFGYKFHDSASVLDEAIKTCDAVDDIYVRRSNEYYVNVKLGKSNPQISATISRILNKDKRVDGVLGSPGNWDVAIEGKDNAEYIKKILSGVGNIK